ncbi:MAG: methyltransferase domain-containing protein [Proteobacteria bacterium]|nr:methyltransferase domain-containing protein [Pseudomonadota bacterium]
MESVDISGRDQFLMLLQGKGIEIGALHRPCVVPHLEVQYVDCLTKEELLEHYPELSNLPLVTPDIIDNAEILKNIPSQSQDYVIANHVIEHMRNPIGALHSWSRVLKTGGRLFLAVPDKHTSFDANRNLTTIEHLEADFSNPSKERDYEHFRDFALEVSCKTFNVKPISEAEDFARHLEEINYSIHFHVWDYESFNLFLNHVLISHPEISMKIISQRGAESQEFIYLLEKL